jgi:hypothetical protein
MDAPLIPVTNRRTGVTSHMSRAHFEKINASPEWKGVFKAEIVQEPVEVTQLKAAQAVKGKGVEAEATEKDQQEK